MESLSDLPRSTHRLTREEAEGIIKLFAGPDFVLKTGDGLSEKEVIRRNHKRATWQLFYKFGNSAKKTLRIYDAAMDLTVLLGAAAVPTIKGTISTPPISSGASKASTVARDQETLAIHQRLQKFYQGLRSAPPARSADEAFNQIKQQLEKVEDLFSGIPKRVNPGLNTGGRMYPPLPPAPGNKYTFRLKDGSIFSFTRKHAISIECDGAIKILHRETGAIEFVKPGASAAK